MRICPDCYAVNRSYHSYCQKCSGSLMKRGGDAYPRMKIKKRATNRRVPTGFLFTF